MANWKFDKFIKKLEEKIERKIDQDNRKICRFFKDSFGKPEDEIDPEEISDTHMYLNPIVTENGRKYKGWGEIKPWLRGKNSEDNCDPNDEPVELDIDYLLECDPEGQVKKDFDLHVHVKFVFTIGRTQANPGIDPDGEGDMRHRRTCEWEPAG